MTLRVSTYLFIHLVALLILAFCDSFPNSLLRSHLKSDRDRKLSGMLSCESRGVPSLKSVFVSAGAGADGKPAQAAM